MVKKSIVIREIKEVFAISLFFFVCFTIFVLMKKLILAEYHIEYNGFIRAAVGALILAKVVLIFDKLSVTKQVDHMPNIFRVGFRSLIYLTGYILFTFLEHAVIGLFNGAGIIESFGHNLENLSSDHGDAKLIILFISFVIFNAFWVIRAHVGPDRLYRLFFNKDV